MTNLDGLIELLEGTEAPESLSETLQIIKNHFRVKHIAYLALHMPPLTRRQIFGQVTYNEQWVSRYTKLNYVKIDPVLPAAMNSIIPVDWNDVRHASDKTINFFRESIDYDVGSQGLTIPIRGANGERSFFSITLDATQAEWKFYKNIRMAELQIIAFYFHKMVVKVNNIKEFNFQLTNRQTEVLTWLARGKSMQDVAHILNISIHTVHAYVETIKAKLGALNTTHAVAKALQHNLILAPDN